MPAKFCTGNKIFFIVGPASILQGQVVTGMRLAEARGRELPPLAEEEETGAPFHYLSEVLKWRAQSTSDHVLFSQVNSKVGGRVLLEIVED